MNKNKKTQKKLQKKQKDILLRTRRKLLLNRMLKISYS